MSRVVLWILIVAMLGVPVAASSGTSDSRGFAPAGQSAWSVFSCIKPAQGEKCRIPVLVDVVDDQSCRLSVPDVIEFESKTTKSLRFRLVPLSVDARKISIGSFEFEHGTGSDLEVDDNDDTDLAENQRRAFRLKRAQTGVVPKTIPVQLITYRIKLKRQLPNGTLVECGTQGPAIVNRG